MLGELRRCGMTVQEVITFLQTLPPDAVVEVFDNDGEMPEKLEAGGSYQISVDG
jgi:hypothetical protein